MKNRKKSVPAEENAPCPEVEKDVAAEAEKPAETENWDAVPEEPEAPVEPQLSEEEKLRAALAEAQSKYLYLQAEYQNYRKRVAKDIADARSYAYADALGPFMTVFDFLAMADSAAMNSDNIESIRQGLKMIIGEFNKAFDSLGVKPLDAVGQPFDPALHEAVMTEDRADLEPGTVSRVMQSGYQLEGRILRPAKVVVNKP